MYTGRLASLPPNRRHHILLFAMCPFFCTPKALGLFFGVHIQNARNRLWGVVRCCSMRYSAPEVRKELEPENKNAHRYDTAACIKPRNDPHKKIWYTSSVACAFFLVLVPVLVLVLHTFCRILSISKMAQRANRTVFNQPIFSRARDR